LLLPAGFSIQPSRQFVDDLDGAAQLVLIRLGLSSAVR
jgi:hypothetical protein